MRSYLSLTLIFFFVLSAVANAKKPIYKKKSRSPSSEPITLVETKERLKTIQQFDNETKDHLKTLQESVDHLHEEVGLLRSRLNQQELPSLINYRNRTFVTFGLAFLSPRQLTFPFPVDSGLGIWLGLGQYFGENHVVDVTLDWDLYPASSLRYHYQFHHHDPAVNFGPVVGYKIRAGGATPLDDFISNPGGVNSSFFFAGGQVSLPISTTLVTFELIYLLNQQAIMVSNLGMVCFF